MPNQVLQLQEISRKTFYDTFALVNTPQNMEHYLHTNLSETQLSNELNNPESEFYFLTSNDIISGYLKLNTGNAQTEKMPNDCFEIERIYILSELKGKGIGQLLLEHAIKIAAKNNFKIIWLAVWEQNPRAIRFYQKNGFEEFGEHYFILGKDNQRDILMKKNVS